MNFRTASHTGEHENDKVGSRAAKSVLNAAKRGVAVTMIAIATTPMASNATINVPKTRLLPANSAEALASSMNLSKIPKKYERAMLEYRGFIMPHSVFKWWKYIDSAAKLQNVNQYLLGLPYTKVNVEA